MRPPVRHHPKLGVLELERRTEKYEMDFQRRQALAVLAGAGIGIFIVGMVLALVTVLL